MTEFALFGITVLALVWIVVLPYVLSSRRHRIDRRIARRS